MTKPARFTQIIEYRGYLVAIDDQGHLWAGHGENHEMDLIWRRIILPGECES